jgi:putative phosphoribosyl transferase
MRAAITAVEKQNPAEVVIAVPVSAQDTYGTIRPMVDRMVCLATPEPFEAVGLWYEDFRQITDMEVRELLERAKQFRHMPAMGEPTEHEHPGVS